MSQTNNSSTPYGTGLAAASAQQSSQNNGKVPKKPNSQGTDIAIGIGVSICGALFNIFPAYAGILSSPWALLFQIIGYCFYIIGFVGTLVNISKSQFMQYLTVTVLFAGIAFLLNYFADITHQTIPALSFFIKLLVLIFACCVTLAFVMSIPQIFAKSQQSQSTTQQMQPNSIQSGQKPKFEHIASIIIVALPLITAIIQFLPTIISLIKTWIK